MQRYLLPILLIASALAAAVPAHAFEGPLQVRNQFPVLLPIDPPYFESARVQDSLSFGLNHSSVYVVEGSASWNVNMDLELTELDIRAKKTLGSRNEVGIDVPFIRPSGGFFDRPLARYHHALGVGDYGRSARPANSFLYQVLYQGRPVIEPRNDKTAMGDVRLTYKHVLTEAPRIVSIRADIELPTGDAKAGYGNGSIDAGLALLADLPWGSTYRGYGMLGVTSPGDFKGYQTIPLRPFGYAGFGVEAAWWRRFSAIVQTVIQSSPYPKTGIRQIDWPGILLTFGGRYAYERGSLEFSLTEDPDTAGAPDFIANITCRMILP